MSVFTDDFVERPYWWDAKAPNDSFSEALPDEVDVLCVGSGYSGLSAALELGRAGLRVVVVDAGAIGIGASTRNGGMLSREQKFASQSDLAARYGQTLALSIQEDGRAAFSNLMEVIEREAIQCHVQLNGRFVGAHCPAAYHRLEERAQRLQAEGVAGFELIPRARQHEIIGASNYYHGGLLEREGGTLHPALYHWGILQACQKYNVHFCAQTRVEGIEKVAARFNVHTSRGVCSAKEVVLGTNGYTGALSPWQRRRIIPVGSHIVATQPIGKDRVESMFRNGCSMSNTQRILYYYRCSPDHERIVFGGRASFTNSDVRTFSRRLHDYMCRVYPDLSDVKLTHGWTGNVAFAFDHLPHMGTHEGVHYCMACNGGGVAMMSYLGRQIGKKILATSNRPCAFESIGFPDHALYAGRPWFLPMVGSWYRFRDFLERRWAPD